MATQKAKRIIKNEDDAYEILKEVLKNEFDGSISLKGWPRLNVHLSGEQFHQSLTPSVMKGYIELQASLYKSYAATAYNDADARRLSRDEKESLEFTVSVQNGSAQLEVNLEETLKYLIDKVSGSMTSHDLLILLLGTGLLYTSGAVIKNFLNNRKTIRMKEIDKEERIESLKTIENMSDKETQRTQLLVKAITKSQQLQAIEPHASDATSELLRSFSTAESTDIQGVRVEGDAIRELSLNARRKPEEAKFDGEYRVLRVDSSDPLVLRVRVRSEDDGEVIEAAVQDELMSQRNKAALQGALFTRQTIFLTVTGRLMDGKLKDAVIRQVKPLPQS